MEVPKVDVLLLGMLAEEPMYGYELIERMHTDGITEWTVVARASVYQALRRLERGGYASSRAHSGREGPDRRTYRITKSGRARLREGLLERFGAGGVYETEAAVPLAFAHLLTSAELRDGLARREALVKRRRETLAEERARIRSSDRSGSAAAVRLLEEQDAFAQAELRTLAAIRRDRTRPR